MHGDFDPKSCQENRSTTIAVMPSLVLQTQSCLAIFRDDVASVPIKLAKRDWVGNARLIMPVNVILGYPNWEIFVNIKFCKLGLNLVGRKVHK